MENSLSPGAALTGEQRAARLIELQALRQSVRDKLYGALPGNLASLADYLRVTCLLDEGDELQRMLATAEAQAAELRKELADQEVEKLALVNELAAYKLVHQGMQTKWHAILRQVMAPLPDFDEAIRVGQAMQRAGYTSDTPLLNCKPGCIACAGSCSTCEKGQPPVFDSKDVVEDKWFSPAVFNSAEAYDASVADVCRRIEAGEITPRQVELASLHRCALCDDSPCGLCPEHAERAVSQGGSTYEKKAGFEPLSAGKLAAFGYEEPAAATQGKEGGAWISPKERLPPDMRSVKVRVIGGEEILALCRENEQGGKRFACSEWGHATYNHGETICGVQEWRELASK